MSATQSELLHAVCAAPDDIGPRMVLADWLQQRGDERGEFIAAQCRLSRRGLDPAMRGYLKKRVRDLLREHEDAWTAGARSAGASKPPQGWMFRDGFLCCVTCAIDQALDGWQALLQVEPIVRMELTGANVGSVKRLATSGLLGRIGQLIIRGTIRDSGVRALAESPDLAHLERLNLKSVGMGDDGVLGLTRALGFRPRRLTFTDNEITDRGATALAESVMASQLDSLYLSRTQISDAGVQALANSPHLGKLQALALGSLEELSDTGAEALAESPYLTSLKYLEVNACYELSYDAVTMLRQRFARVRADF